MSRLLWAAMAILVAAMLAACTATTGATPSLTPEPPGPTPTEGTDDGETPIGDADLEALLPTEVGGIALEYESMTGAEMVAEEGVTPEVQEFLDRTGSDLDDVSVAFGFGFDAETSDVVSIIAFRVAGASPDQLIAEMEAAMEAEAENAQISEGSLGGKDVTIVATGDGPEQVMTYIYARNDIAFMVGASSEDLAEEALSKLP